MSNLAKELLQFTEQKRLLYQRIRDKLNLTYSSDDLDYMTNNHNNTHRGDAIHDSFALSDKTLDSLLFEASEVVETVLDSKGITINNDLKFKFISMYTSALAKEASGRKRGFFDNSNNEFSERVLLLGEAKIEIARIIELLNQCSSTKS